MTPKEPPRTVPAWTVLYPPGTYLDGELFPLEFEGQVLVVRELGEQAVQAGHLPHVEQA